MQLITNSSAIMPGMMQFSYFYGNVHAGLKKAALKSGRSSGQ